MNLNIEEAFRTYLIESRELLQQMEDGLLTLEQNASDKELINSIFRAAHTIKGSAGMFALDEIVTFTHHVEHLLDLLRNNKCQISGRLVEVLLASKDQIDLLVNLAESATRQSPAQSAAERELIHQIEAFCGAGKAAAARPVPEAEASVSNGDAANQGRRRYLISARFNNDMLSFGNDPIPMLKYLADMGRLLGCEAVVHGVPPLHALQPGICYIGFEAVLESAATQEAIEGTFDFVRDESDIAVLCLDGDAAARLQKRLAALAEPAELINDIWQRLGVDVMVMGATTAEPKAADDARVDVMATAHVASASAPAAAVATSTSSGATPNKRVEESVIRVESPKLDSLINLVGELVIAASGAGSDAAQSGNTALVERLELLTRLVERVRDAALSMRMVQIGTVFHRFQRVVRDVGKELGKDIELVIEGAETELDKTLVEKISDPLMHLVRNAIDHGIESPERRQAAGKPARGHLRLSSHHESGSVVIEVSDDGGGLNRDKIIEKAIARGLIDRASNMADKDVWNLIFEPGFSTADKVTNISGRGVGMDVVRRNIAALRGTIEVQSQQGIGMTVRIRLPLTLAIIDGFVIGVGAAKYVVPLDLVIECIDLGREEYQYSNDRDFIYLRGEALPFIRLREMFGIGASHRARANLVVVAYGGHRAGLVVDSLLGESQTVIKPLGRVFEKLRGIGGSTILGSGEVALIIDVPSLITKASEINRSLHEAA